MLQHIDNIFDGSCNLCIHFNQTLWCITMKSIPHNFYIFILLQFKVGELYLPFTVKWEWTILELDDSLIFWITQEIILFEYQIGERCVLSDPKLKWWLRAIEIHKCKVGDRHPFSDLACCRKYGMRDTLFMQVLDHFGP